MFHIEIKTYSPSYAEHFNTKIVKIGPIEAKLWSVEYLRSRRVDQTLGGHISRTIPPMTLKFGMN